MSAWDLPETVSVGGRDVPVRTDFRAVLDILEVLGDPEIGDAERAYVALQVFYEDLGAIDPSDYREACERLMWFVGGGDSPARPPKRKLADWSQDFPIIVPAVNRVLGYECRSVGHLHWWTFLGAYMEVGDCLFAQVVAIRKKKSKGKKLDKHEEAFYRENRGIVDLKSSQMTAADWAEIESLL